MAKRRFVVPVEFIVDAASGREAADELRGWLEGVLDIAPDDPWWAGVDFTIDSSRVALVEAARSAHAVR